MASWDEDTRRFLEAHRVGHLATAGADGAPHVVPVCYALDDDALYVVADAKPKRRPARTLQRLENLRANPRAALVVDDYDDDWTRLAWVLVRGPATIVEDDALHAAALARLRARYAPYRAMALDDRHAHPIVRLEPLRVRWWRAADGA
jgi:PPOX class probable F420-dependent enzyme